MLLQQFHNKIRVTNKEKCGKIGLNGEKQNGVY